MDGIVLVCRLLLGLTFLASGIGKCGRFRSFQRHLRAYELLPVSLAALSAAVIVILELLSAALLFSARFQTTGSLISIALLCVFTGAVAASLRRGKRDLSCGCFVIAASPTLGTHVMLRNAGFVALACAQFVNPVACLTSFFSLLGASLFIAVNFRPLDAGRLPEGSVPSEGCNACGQGLGVSTNRT